MARARPRRATLLVGCGRLGSAMVQGWLKTHALDPHDLIILSPSEKPASRAARALGARVNPEDGCLDDVDSVVLAIKPATWREATRPLVGRLRADAVIVSVMAGVRSADLAQVFPDRSLARVMPTTGVAVGQGVASLWATDPKGLIMAQGLFNRIARTVLLESEPLIDVATAVSGSGPAYFFAFAEALARAGVTAGLDPDTAAVMARGTLASAAASAEGDTAGFSTLIHEVASPGGTTEAGLNALNGPLDRLVDDAVRAAVARAEALSRG